MPPKRGSGKFSKTVSYCARVKAHTSQRPTRPELISDFRSMKQAMEYCYSPLDRMPVHRRITPSPPPPSSVSPVPIYTPGWRETKWSKVPCLRKQRDGRGLNPGPPDPDPEFEVLTARPHTPPPTMQADWIMTRCGKPQHFIERQCLQAQPINIDVLYAT